MVGHVCDRQVVLTGIMASALSTLAMAAPVTAFQLSDVKLDGQAGENTYFFGSITPNPPPSFDGTTLSTGGISGGRYAYFVSYFPQQTLANVGDKLVFTFTADLTGTISTNAQSLRLGLFNSAGSKVSTGNLSTGGDTAMANYVGYDATYRVDNTAPTSAHTLYQRSASNNVLQSTSSFTSLSGPTLPQLNLTSGVSFSGVMTLERVASGIQFTTNLKNTGDQSVMDIVSPYTTFDTVSMFYIPSVGPAAMNVTALSVQLVPIPEPTSVALVGMVAGVGILRRRRGL